jgi:hypothetical protein
LEKKEEAVGSGKYRYIETRQELLDTDPDETEYLLGMTLYK